MLSPSEQRVLTERFRRRILGISERSALVLAAAWDRLGAYDEVDVPRFSDAVAVQVQAVTAATTSLSTVFYRLLLEQDPSVPFTAPIPDLRRPFTAYWHSLSEGNPWQVAHRVGRSDAEALGRSHAMSTSRLAGDQFTPSGWRRVPGGKSCDWCLTVARQVYRTAQTADFGHDRCDCIAVPITSA